MLEHMHSHVSGSLVLLTSSQASVLQVQAHVSSFRIKSPKQLSRHSHSQEEGFTSFKVLLQELTAQEQAQLKKSCT
jgi:hypothetical protein